MVFNNERLSFGTGAFFVVDVGCLLLCYDV